MSVTLPVEDFSPVYTGDIGATFAPVIVDVNNNAIILTGATLTTRMTLLGGTTVKTWNPAYWSIDDPINAKAHYNYQTSDVDTPGLWQVQTTITINGRPQHTDVRILEIRAAI